MGHSLRERRPRVLRPVPKELIATFTSCIMALAEEVEMWNDILMWNLGAEINQNTMNSAVIPRTLIFANFTQYK